MCNKSFSFLLFLTATVGTLTHNKTSAHPLSLREKIARLIVVAAVSNEATNQQFMVQSPYKLETRYVEDLIKNHHIRSLLFLGNGTIGDFQSTIARFKGASPEPLFFALDAEWPAMRIQDLPCALRLPRAMTLGALSNHKLTAVNAYITGLLLRHLGIDMNLAPVADVNNNPDNPVINVRSFGADPARVTSHMLAYLKGLAEAGIISCVKHFPGHGDTNVDSHYALPVMQHDRARLTALELVPFRAAIKEKVPALMIGHLFLPLLESTPDLPATLSKTIVTDLLRTQLDFDGVIVTDGLGMRGITNYVAPGELEVRALEAGVDLLLCPGDKQMPIPQIIDAIEKAVQSGRISQESIDQKVARVMRMQEQSRNNRHTLPSWQALLALAQDTKEAIFTNAITIAKNSLAHPADAHRTISLTGLNPYKSRNYGILHETFDLIKKIHDEGNTVTAVVYGSPYVTECIKEYADSIVIAYEDEPEAHNAVQEILAKRKDAVGILPI